MDAAGLIHDNDSGEEIPLAGNFVELIFTPDLNFLSASANLIGRLESPKIPTLWIPASLSPEIDAWRRSETFAGHRLHRIPPARERSPLFD